MEPFVSLKSWATGGWGNFLTKSHPSRFFYEELAQGKRGIGKNVFTAGTLQRWFNSSHIFHRKWERTDRGFILKMAFVTRYAITENKIELCSSILYHPNVYFKAGPVDPLDSELAFYLGPVFFREGILFFLCIKCGWNEQMLNHKRPKTGKENNRK